MRFLPLCLLLTLSLACKKKNSAPEESFGCVTLAKGEEMSCIELDPSTDLETRVRVANECQFPAMKSLSGRTVVHCPTEGLAAKCEVAANKRTLLYYKSDMNPEKLKGSRIGCKVAGGTFVEVP